MVKSKCMVWLGLATTLVFMLSLFASCKQNANGADKPRVKSSNAKVKSITVNSQSYNLEKEEEVQEFYVDEDAEESELLSQIVVVFEDANAKKDIVGANENVFEKKPHEEKIYTINTFAEDGTKGKSYKFKLIRFIIDKTIEVKAPASPFKSGLEFNYKPDYMALGNGRTIDFDTYKIAKYEVTYKLWKEVYDAGKANGYKFSWEPPTTEVKKEDLLKPIVNINWADAVVWCNAYSEYKKSKGLDFSPIYVKEGTEDAIKDATDFSTLTNSVSILINKQGIRLPSEVEWEVAARGGDPTKPEWKYDFAGTNEEAKLGEYAWYSANSESKFHRVGEKKPNSIGICDMSGNAREFCFDFIDYAKPFKQEGSVINPLGFKAGAVPSRVEKGGAYTKEAKFLKLANRSAIVLIPAIEENGFRFVEAKNTRPFMYETEPVDCEVEEITVGNEVFTKDKLNTLNGTTVNVSSTPTTIIVKYPLASSGATLKINDGTPLSFTGGLVTTTVETNKKTNSITLEVSDIGKKTVSWSFTIANSNGEGGTTPPPPPPPPGP